MKLNDKSILLVAIVFSMILFGCIKDDYDDCTQGINIHFYSKTSCQADTVYPEVDVMTLCVFDKDGVLATYQQKDGLALNKDYTESIEINSGLYTVVAWTGLDDSNYDINGLQNGVTKKHDLLFRLKRLQNQAYSIDGTEIYYGESPAVYVSKAEDSQSIFENTAVNLFEQTNRLTVSVEGLDITNLDNYEITIESDNGSMNLDGTIASDGILVYNGEYIDTPGILEAKFTLLKLETGNENTIVIKDKLNNTELYRESLLGTLLLKNPEVNLNCDHDFTIRFTAKDQCQCGTYTIMEIWVNNWLVHSYDTDM